MAITRTAMVDDDGTGTTGTIINAAWKTELYNQIDAADVLASTPTYGSWTPTDASGAALVLTGVVGQWAKYGRLVFVWGTFSYPNTANGANAKVGSLPYFVRSATAGCQAHGIHRMWWLPVNTKDMIPVIATSGLNATNAQLSVASFIISAVYLTD